MLRVKARHATKLQSSYQNLCFTYAFIAFGNKWKIKEEQNGTKKKMNKNNNKL